MSNPPDRSRSPAWPTLRHVLVVSLVLFAACLWPIGFCESGRCTRGLSALLVGSLGLLYTPLGTLPWLANPALAAAWLGCLYGSRRWSLICSLAALALAGSFLWHRTVVTDESGVPALVTRIGPAYWLWLASMVTVAIAATRPGHTLGRVR
jgi:hypothetical protein